MALSFIGFATLTLAVMADLASAPRYSEMLIVATIASLLSGVVFLKIAWRSSGLFSWIYGVLALLSVCLFSDGMLRALAGTRLIDLLR